MTLTRGDVYYDIGFVYDGTTTPCDKLLLIVNKNHQNDQDIIYIPCTTHRDQYKFKNGCNEIEKIFYFEKKIGFYDEKTNLQLYLINSITQQEFDGHLKSGRIKPAAGKKTTTDEINQIMNCLKKMKDDIEWYINDLIF